MALAINHRDNTYVTENTVRILANNSINDFNVSNQVTFNLDLADDEELSWARVDFTDVVANNATSCSVAAGAVNIDFRDGSNQTLNQVNMQDLMVHGILTGENSPFGNYTGLKAYTWNVSSGAGSTFANENANYTAGTILSPGAIGGTVGAIGGRRNIVLTGTHALLATSGSPPFTTSNIASMGPVYLTCKIRKYSKPPKIPQAVPYGRFLTQDNGWTNPTSGTQYSASFTINTNSLCDMFFYVEPLNGVNGNQFTDIDGGLSGSFQVKNSSGSILADMLLVDARYNEDNDQSSGFTNARPIYRVKFTEESLLSEVIMSNKAQTITLVVTPSRTPSAASYNLRMVALVQDQLIRKGSEWVPASIAHV